MVLGMLASLLSWAPGAPLVTSEVASEGPLRRRLTTDDADLVLLVASEQSGQVGPCVCSLEPLGGLERIVRVRNAMQRKQPSTPIVTLNAGGLLSPSSRETDAAMAEAARVFDVVLATRGDRPGLPATSALPWVSATLSEVPPVRVVHRDGLALAVTGATASFSADPVATVAQVVRTLKADLVVVLAFDVPKRLPELVDLPGVDVVVEAGGYRARYGPFTDDDTVWVRSWRETAVLGELRLWLEDGAIGRATYRWVRLDAKIR